MQPDIIIPATSGVDRYLSLLELECRRLASDQEVRDARAAQSSDVVVAAEVAAKGRVVRVFTSAARERGQDVASENASDSEGGSRLSEAAPVDSRDSTGRAIDSESESESESDSESEGHHRPPFWHLVLHETEYALLSNGATQLLTHAIAPCQQVNGPNLIAVGIWQILEELDFALPVEDIQIGYAQYIVEAHQTFCVSKRGSEAGGFGPEESGREQMLALRESEVPPRTEHWALD
eukprot:s1170_g24.t1